ncbi:MAG TPA: Uma2 family endonuclease [Pirellulales bacterium]|nr:Uma2 family endonuclease [Pirellulales bacterium]
MSTESYQPLSWPLVLQMGPVLGRLSESEFFDFCQLNRELRIERTHDGELIIMPPAGSDSGRRNLSLAAQLWIWSQADRTGVCFDSSSGFRLPNGATRSPDAAWIKRERWDALTSEEQEEFAPLAPDFVAELRSKTDSLRVLRAKMREYLDNGVRLGWLVDPKRQQVEVFRPGQRPERIDHPTALRGDPELPGFVLDLRQVWS